MRGDRPPAKPGSTPAPFGTRGTRCRQSQLTIALGAAKKFLLLLIDELDEMYTLNRDDHPKGSFNANQTLAQLKSLGNESSGRYFTIVCGSSASLPSLLEARGDNIDKLRRHVAEATFLTGGNARLLTKYLGNTKVYLSQRNEDGTHDAQLDEEYEQLRIAI